MSDTKTDPGTDLAPIPEDSTALVTGGYVFTAEQKALIKRTIAKDCTDDELALFVHVCRRLRLDPIAKQIYAIKMEGKLVIQTGIDGLRLIAQRTGRFRGVSDPEWCGEDGAWKEVWTDMDTYPRAARVRVMVQGPDDLEPMVVSGVANFSEYAFTKSDGNLNARWTKAPVSMIAKCAEALALRRAFPDELSGLFSFDETSSNYEKDASAPKVLQPARKSEKAAKKDAAKSALLPDASPWEGDLDDVIVVGPPDGTAKAWRLNADQGRIAFFTDQEDIKDRAAAAMSNAKAVRVEWKTTSKGNAEVETLTILQDA